MSTLSGLRLDEGGGHLLGGLEAAGVTSVAVMLWETSMAMMTVPAERGVGTSTVRPAMARASTARPPKDSHRPAGTGGADLPRTPAEASARAAVDR